MEVAPPRSHLLSPAARRRRPGLAARPDRRSVLLCTRHQDAWATTVPALLLSASFISRTSSLLHQSTPRSKQASKHINIPSLQKFFLPWLSANRQASTISSLFLRAAQQQIKHILLPFSPPKKHQRQQLPSLQFLIASQSNLLQQQPSKVKSSQFSTPHATSLFFPPPCWSNSRTARQQRSPLQVRVHLISIRRQSTSTFPWACCCEYGRVHV